MQKKRQLRKQKQRDRDEASEGLEDDDAGEGEEEEDEEELALLGALASSSSAAALLAERGDAVRSGDECEEERRSQSEGEFCGAHGPAGGGGGVGGVGVGGGVRGGAAVGGQPHPAFPLPRGLLEVPPAALFPFDSPHEVARHNRHVRAMQTKYQLQQRIRMHQQQLQLQKPGPEHSSPPASARPDQGAPVPPSASTSSAASLASGSSPFALSQLPAPLLAPAHASRDEFEVDPGRVPVPAHLRAWFARREQLEARQAQAHRARLHQRAAALQEEQQEQTQQQTQQQPLP